MRVIITSLLASALMHKCTAQGPPANVQVHILNPEATEGVSFAMGWNQFQFVKTYTPEGHLFYDYDGAPNGMASPHNLASSMAMFINDGGAGMTVLDAAGDLEESVPPGPTMQWTTVATYGATGQSGTVYLHLVANVNSLDYTIDTTVTYAFPNNFVIIDWEFTIPDGHPSTYDVIAYYVSDPADALTPTPYANSTLGVVGVTYTDDTFLGFRHISGIEPKYVVDWVNCGAWDSCNGSPATGYYTHEECNNHLGTPGADSGLHLSFGLGDQPGTYTSSAMLIFDQLDAVLSETVIPPQLSLCTGCYWEKGTFMDSSSGKSANLADIPSILFVDSSEGFVTCLDSTEVAGALGRLEIPLASSDSIFPYQLKVSTYSAIMDGVDITIDFASENIIMRWMHHAPEASPSYKYHYVDTGFRSVAANAHFPMCIKIELVDTKDQPKTLTLPFLPTEYASFAPGWRGVSGLWSELVDPDTGVIDTSKPSTLGERQIAMRVQGRTVVMAG